MVVAVVPDCVVRLAICCECAHGTDQGSTEDVVPVVPVINDLAQRHEQGDRNGDHEEEMLLETTLVVGENLEFGVYPQGYID